MHDVGKMKTKSTSYLVFYNQLDSFPRTVSTHLHLKEIKKTLCISTPDTWLIERKTRADLLKLWLLFKLQTFNKQSDIYSFIIIFLLLLYPALDTFLADFIPYGVLY